MLSYFCTLVNVASEVNCKLVSYDHFFFETELKSLFLQDTAGFAVPVASYKIYLYASKKKFQAATS